MREIVLFATMIVIIFVGLIFIISGLIYWYTEKGIFKSFYHDKLGWHKPTEDIYLEPLSVTPKSVCKYCGVEIMQDSQGNWY